MEQPKKQFLNSLALKIIGIITMTLDHIGVFLIRYANPFHPIGHKDFFTVPMATTGYIFRCIGRLALPIFLILFIEGLRYTKNKKLYFTRIGIMAGVIMLAEMIMFFTNGITLDGNIFLTMLCSGLFVTLLERKDNKKYYCILPLVFLLIGTVSVFYKSFNDGKLLWWPDFLLCEYSIYGFLLFLGFYYSYKIADDRVIKITNGTKDINELRLTPYYRSITNIFWALTIFIVTMLFYLLSLINSGLDIYFMQIQSWALIACIIPLLYNGKKGYNNKVLQHGFYLYYPIHILIIFIIFFAIYGVIK